MYPSLILILVNKERSIVNSFGFSTALGNDLDGKGHADAEHRPATIGHLVFANPPTGTGTKSTGTVDNESSLTLQVSHPTVSDGPTSSNEYMA